MAVYEGLLTAMVTPLAPDGSVDEDGFVRIGRHLLDNGSDALVVAGTTGESATLKDEEQIRLFEIAAQEFGPFVAGTGSNDTHHACHLTEKAVEAGASAVLSVTPYYNKPNRRGVHAHYAEVARAAQGVPVILYNIPGRTALNLPPDQLAALAQIPGVEAVKQANPAELQPIDGLALLAGNDDDLARTLDLGGAGGICVSSHVAGPQMKRLFTEPDQRAEIDATLKPLYDAMFITASPGPVKAALHMLGLPAGPLRLPLVECDPDEIAHIRGVLDHLGLLDRATA